MRRNFSSSKFVQLLGALGNPVHPGRDIGGTVDGSGQDFAEKLSLWVSVFESVTLYEAHQAVSARAGEEPLPLAPRRALPLNEQLHQVRATLTHAINTLHYDDATDKASSGDKATIQSAPTPERELDFAPYRQRYMEQQRNMDLMIRALRDNVRQTLKGTSPELRNLAALDAVWEQILGAREQKLLTTVPARLKRRFDSLQKLHQREAAANPAPEQQEESQQYRSDAQSSRQPRGWLDLFERELHEILLAELEVRLEPVTGLIEAFNNANKADGAAGRGAGNQVRNYV
ncbi:MAG: DUF3348 family protein [Pseudomonadota bacterium]